MNGVPEYLRKGTRLIVDTMILVNAADDQRAGASESSPLRLLRLILDYCPVIVFSKAQDKANMAHFRRKGFRIPQQQIPYLRELDEEEKWKPLKKRGVLAEKVRREFSKRGHDNITDDLHLYEAARVADGFIITEDCHLIDRRAEIDPLTGVQRLHLDEVIEAVFGGAAEEEE